MNSKLKAALRLALFASVTVPLMPLQFAFIHCWPRMASRFPQHYHKMVCGILGFKISVQGALPDQGPCLIVSNHVSWIDIVALGSAAPVSFVAKSEVARWPVFGTMARLQRTLFVDRERRHSTGNSSSQLALRLAAGETLVLFPEGTSHDGASILPFKSSFFAAAATPGTRVVPVTLVYSHARNLPLTRRNRGVFAWYADMDLLPHLWGVLKSGPLHIDVIVHPPLAQDLGRKALAGAAEKQIRNSLADALHSTASRQP